MEIPVSVWTHYGYSASPYSTTALRIDEADARLLVGRETELGTILRDLASGVQVVAIEGDYGVGKSSLAAVAAAQASGWKKRRSIAPLFLASNAPLELNAADTATEFEKRAYYQVASAILHVANELVRDGVKLQQLDEFRRWLTTAEASSWSAGIGLNVVGLGGSLSGGKGRSTNNSAGFNDAGIVTLIDDWLKEIFPTPQDGGVVLLLDNLEVMVRAPEIVQLFESLRDRLFKRDGLRWIISGAEGTVRAALTTPKMSGVFQNPIDLKPIGPELVSTVITTRADVLRVRADATLPVSPAAFEDAYLQTGKNLRVALGLAERFALRSDPRSVTWMTTEDRDKAFLEFRNAEGVAVVKTLSRAITKTGWRVLRTLVLDMDGVAYPSDFPSFGYKSMSSLLHQVQPLVELGLIDYTVDEDDGRRRLITAKENGRLAVGSASAQSA